MSLIKCPECGHMISECANKCVSCGCPMSKISELLTRKKTKSKVPSITGETKNNFREDVLSFLNATKNELFRCGIKTVLSNNKDVVGLRTNKKDHYCIYFSKNKDNVISIHFINRDKNIKKTQPFDSNKEQEYLDFIKYELFNIDKKIEIARKKNANSDEEPYYVQLLSQFKKKYKYTVKNDEVVRINVLKLVPTDNPKFIEVAYPNGDVETVNIDSARYKLFENRYFAGLSLNDNADNFSIEKGRFVIKEKTTEQYFKGIHKSKQYETYRTQYHKSVSGYVTTEVPDFTPNVNDAQVFFDIEGAKNIVSKFDNVVGELEIIKL